MRKDADNCTQQAFATDVFIDKAKVKSFTGVKQFPVQTVIFKIIKNSIAFAFCHFMPLY